MFEDWLKGRLQEACGESGEEFQAVIDGLQAQIDTAAEEKTTLVDGFFADFGGDDETIMTYSTAIDQLY
jgi:hypothetical protein